MTGLADWETEGAKPRAPMPTDDVAAPTALRVVTWIGVVLLVAATVTFIVAASLSPDDTESAGHFAMRLHTTVLAGMSAAVVGALTLVLRLVAGVIVRAVSAAR
jgi:hypothetical protein